MRTTTCREKEAPKVWQARENTTLDDYDAVTVRLRLSAALLTQRREQLGACTFASWLVGRSFLCKTAGRLVDSTSVSKSLPCMSVLQGDVYAAAAAAVGTDFRQWSEAEVRTFLDQRGEDYDDCPDFDALVRVGSKAHGTVNRAVNLRRACRRAASELKDGDSCSGDEPVESSSRSSPSLTWGGGPPMPPCLLQCKRAAECEANTGPAQRPSLAAAGGEEAEGAGGDEVGCAWSGLMPFLPGLVNNRRSRTKVQSTCFDLIHGLICCAATAPCRWTLWTPSWQRLARWRRRRRPSRAPSGWRRKTTSPTLSRRVGRGWCLEAVLGWFVASPGRRDSQFLWMGSFGEGQAVEHVQAGVAQRVDASPDAGGHGPGVGRRPCCYPSFMRASACPDDEGQLLGRASVGR